MTLVFEPPMPDPVHLEEHLGTDMELAQLYRDVLRPRTCFGEQMLERWTKRCSTNVKFLEETQRLLQTRLPHVQHDCDAMNEVRRSITADADDAEEEGFHAKYQYMDWAPLKFLNRNSTALQWMSAYNLTSPIISLCVPIICLIIPFFVIRLRGIAISLTSYVTVLQEVLRRHQLGQLFTLSSATWEKRMYILISAGFYILGIYQNIRSCVRFYANMTTIHHELGVVRRHVSATIEHMRTFEDCLSQAKATTYKSTRETLRSTSERLAKYRAKLDRISPLPIGSNKEEGRASLTSLFEIGHVMECFYELYHDREIHSLLKYTCDFCGYLDNLEAVARSDLGLCRFDRTKDKFYNAYLPNHRITNTYSITKHSLITGPNAAGKTTLLKATLFNIVLSQQFGRGCYARATLRPFHHIHSYLNIPDTNGRDSLFQAEARRCKSILDSVADHSESERHFCVFDELYSGTNPYEAVGSAVAFLQYLNHRPNVTFMLTTHFVELCEQLEHVKGFRNRHMAVSSDNSEFRYLYKVADGISTIKGGVKVLKELDYPETIVSNAYTIINEPN